MSARWILQGPFPLDLRDPSVAARAAADVAQRWLRVDRARAELADLSTHASEPGLYLIWSADPEPAVAGFWLSFGPEYLVDGPPGPPDREVPFVREVLNALTEAVWWQNLTVTPLERSIWRPVVVLEWLPAIASRSPFAPPGVEVERRARIEEEQAQAGEGGGWLIPSGSGLGVGVQRETSEGLTDFLEPVDLLPAARSLLCVVRGELKRGFASHSGAFEPVDPEILAGPLTEHRVPFSDWLVRGTLVGPVGPPEDEHPKHGLPLGLPGERIGFPIYGWLTRSLGVWPPRSASVRAGALQPRDIGRRWLRQMRTATSTTVVVILAGLALAAAIVVLTRPALQAAPPAPRQAPQPALSLCSADHEEFIAELRCQLDHFGRGGDPKAAVCRDVGSPVNRKMRDYMDAALQRRNLHPTWCGVHDRALDNSRSPEGDADWTQLVAARACFNVLGHPYTYTWAAEGTGGSADWPDPAALLQPGNLQVKPLAQMVQELNSTCDTVRPKLERNVEGAVLAAHIGTAVAAETEPTTDGQRLRRAMTLVAEEGMRRGEADCLEAGIDRGVGEAARFGSLCTPDAGVFAPVSRSDSWASLAGAYGEDAPRQPVVEAYVAARFPEDTEDYPALWQCHLELDGELDRSGRALAGRWDLRAPMPARYRAPARIGSQLILDAALLSIEDGTEPDPCWSVLAQRLNRYRPLHPVLEPLAEGEWPSVEQQLCGQICAAYYSVADGPEGDAWVTATSDLDLCIRTAAPGEEGPALDQLRLPWNGRAGDDWRAPSREDVCAFNLVAQSYLPAGDVPLISGDIAPFDWAGEADLGAGVAGGAYGEAARAATSLRSYGRARSVETCGYAAVQCLTSGLLEVTGDPKGTRQDWSRLWSAWMKDLVRARKADLDDDSPWCGLIHPYLPRAGRLPEGQLDYPCAKGVDDVRQAVEATLNTLALGSAERTGG